MEKSKAVLNISSLENFLGNYSKPLIIAGPCGAETEEQVLKTAHEIARSGKVKIFRAGVWKPRTRPGSFEGAGNIALQWMQSVKKETGLLTTVEVANTEHVEAALSHDIDILWIGARTTVNPFLVQEIADAIKGTNITMMVKNPITPDLPLWIGALERLNKAGISKLIAVHRGFHSYEKSNYRNIPKWEIPLELKRFYPELPVICDVSHICGRTDIIHAVAQKALDLDFSGLMIETHINPKEALSDAEQQVTPNELSQILDCLTVRTNTSDNKEFVIKLEQLRSIIDEMDEEVIRALGKRMNISQNIGEFKRDNNVTIYQARRWEEVITRRLHLGESLGLSKEFVKELLQLLHKESIRRQAGVMNANMQQLEMDNLSKINEILNSLE